ncbi:MAG: glycoside-pentoside-hexuronide (GPH):cation symporter [Turicibacter sp.]
MSQSMFLTSKFERLAYGGYFVGQNIIYFLVFQFLMLFYTDIVGLSASAVGTMFLIARLFDAVNDPIMGVIVDKANLKRGKFIPWVKLVIFLMPLATLLLFMKVGDGGLNTLIYAYVTYIIWGIIYTISDVPIFALATVMTNNSDERVQLISIGRIGAGIGSVVISLFVMPMVLRIEWVGTVVLLSMMALIFMLPVGFFAKERIVYQRKEALSLKRIVQFIGQNKYLLIFYSAIIISSLTNTSAVSINYFAIYNLGSQRYISTLTIANMIPMLLVPFVLPPLIKRFGKKKIFIGGFLASIIASILFYLIGYNNIVLVHIFTAIKGIGQLPTFMIGLFTVDCIEYGTFTTGQRAEGVAFSLQTFTVKLSAAIAGAASGFVLESIGYQPGIPQTTEALTGIWNMYALYPIIGGVVAIFIIWKYYDLTEKDVNKMIIENGKND